jgi:hypothetical protein
MHSGVIKGFHRLLPDPFFILLSAPEESEAPIPRLAQSPY